MIAPPTLVSVARSQAGRRPHEIAFTFLADGDRDERNRTFAELDSGARRVAGRLAARVRRGDRVLIALPPGLDFVEAFLGIQYAGAVPVQAHAPDGQRTGDRTRAVVADATPVAVICEETDRSRLATDVPGLPAVTVESWADAPTDVAVVEPTPDDLAFLQYTSGSTSTPRGVRVTHANATAQLAAMSVNDAPDVVAVCWLPFQHDLGLVGGVLAPIFYGHRCVFFSPLAFASRPVRWLKAISRYRGTSTGGPNFAYELCLSKIDPADCADLDLSSLRILLSGAEPVRPETMDRFTARFRPYGFSPSAWMPCYGLAEAVLGVTQTCRGRGATATVFTASGLDRNLAEPVDAFSAERTRTLVSVGRPLAGTNVLIVDPATRDALPDGRVGEVWVGGASVADGYWTRPDDTATTFRATTADGRGPFLRTGDLGFAHGGDFYLTGRRKDLIIFAGRNVYPQDVEETVVRCHSSFKPNSAVAFAFDKCGRERLVVVAELSRPQSVDLTTLAKDIRQRIEFENELPLDGLVFVRVGSLPKTSSGKVRRNAAREALAAGRFDPLGEHWFAGAPSATCGPLPSASEVKAWLAGWVASRHALPVSEVSTDAPLESFVADSITTVALAMDLQNWLCREVPMRVLFERPSIDRLADRLADPTTYADS